MTSPTLNILKKQLRLLPAPLDGMFRTIIEFIDTPQKPPVTPLVAADTEPNPDERPEDARGPYPHLAARESFAKGHTPIIIDTLLALARLDKTKDNGLTAKAAALIVNVPNTNYNWPLKYFVGEFLHERLGTESYSDPMIIDLIAHTVHVYFNYVTSVKSRGNLLRAAQLADVLQKELRERDNCNTYLPTLYTRYPELVRLHEAIHNLVFSSDVTLRNPQMPLDVLEMLDRYADKIKPTATVKSPPKRILADDAVDVPVILKYYLHAAGTGTQNAVDKLVSSLVATESATNGTSSWPNYIPAIIQLLRAPACFNYSTERATAIVHSLHAIAAMSQVEQAMIGRQLWGKGTYKAYLLTPHNEWTVSARFLAHVEEILDSLFNPPAQKK